MLSRFNSAGNKLSRFAEFPPVLDLSECATPGERPAPYALRAVVAHSGDAIDDGHYWTFAKHGTTWWKCDDATVSEVSALEVLRAQAYLLVYNLAS